MNPQVEAFLERPLSHKVGILLGILVFLSYCFWQFMYKANFEEATELEEKVAELETNIVKEQRIARNLKKFQREVKELDIKLKFALQELPDKREIPDLLRSISDLARDAGLEVTLFKPRGENFRDFYAEVPVEIKVAGAYHQVATFFDEVGQLSRIVNINDIIIDDPEIKNSIMNLATSCVATTFRYLDEEERQRMQEAAEAAEADGGRRGGKRRGR